MQVAAADAIPAGLLERIPAGESQTLEFKTSLDKASNESLVALNKSDRYQQSLQISRDAHIAPNASLADLSPAMTLFADQPLRCHIDVGRFKTASMIIDDRQFTDTPFEVVEPVMKFNVSHMSVALELGDNFIQADLLRLADYVPVVQFVKAVPSLDFF